MSNVHNLFDYQKDDPLIVSFVTFLRKCGTLARSEAI